METYAPQIRQKDGSVVLERKPQSDAKPAQELPKGAKAERVGSVVVRPKATFQMDAPPTLGYGDVRVDWSLVKMPDQTRRMVMSSPDGEIVGGVDVPIESAREQRKLKWAVGAVYGTTAWGDKAVGAFVDRDFAFVRTGAEVTKNTYAQTGRQAWEVRAKFGIRF